jgi:hypothetical protein
MAKKSETVEPRNPNPDWQDKDIRISGIIVSVAIVLVTTALTFVAMKIMMNAYKEWDVKRGEQVVSPLARDRTLPPGPRLQVYPRDELAEHRRTEQERLAHYEWIDPNFGLAKIPIDRAVEIVVESGVPIFEPVPGVDEEAAESAE